MKNVLNYFVRKAFGFKSTATAEDKTLFGHLLRIRQNIQGVYDWLYGRLSAEHLPKRMPMTEAVTSADGHEVHIAKAWNSANLLAHLRLLDGRKISNGYADGTPADDGLPDGVSLARILCDSSLQPTALIDDNVGWVMDGKVANLATNFPNVKRLVLGCKEGHGQCLYNTSIQNMEFPHLEEVSSESVVRSGFIHEQIYGYTPPTKSIIAPKLKRILNQSFYYTTHSIAETVEELSFPELVEINANGCAYLAYSGDRNLKRMYFLKIESSPNIYWGGGYSGCGMLICNNQMESLEYIYIGYDTNDSRRVVFNIPANSAPKLLTIELKEGYGKNISLVGWSPTLDSSNLSLFLDNFLHFIAERVAEGNYTLTLSAAVYAALEQQEGQTILALLNTKGWTVASA